MGNLSENNQYEIQKEFNSKDLEVTSLEEMKVRYNEMELKNRELRKIIDALNTKQERFAYENIKTEFFANISHEFKTPLNILMGAMQLLELYASNGVIMDPHLKLSKYMETMKQNANRLLRLINNLIDLTKIDSSYYEVEFFNIEIVSIIENIVNSIEIYANMKSISVTFIKDVDEKIIACDVDKIERVLLNLLSNAIKFTDEGGKIEVRVSSVGNNFYISVKDDGIGIPEDKLDVIFQRFRQLDKSFSRNREGSGIGLSLVKAIVEMHQGRITVESHYGKGSIFFVELPVRVVKSSAAEMQLAQFEDRRNERIRIEFSDLD